MGISTSSKGGELYMRPSAEYYKKISENKPIVAVEIGVLKGNNAKQMLENMNIKKLYLIDPYEPYDKKQDPKNLKEIEEEAKDLLKEFKNVVWIKKLSENAINDIKEEPDYIYIDGDHRYETIKKDLELYYKILKKKGLLAGHDFDPEYKKDLHNGVKKAVKEFHLTQNLQLYRCDVDWWVLK